MLTRVAALLLLKASVEMALKITEKEIIHNALIFKSLDANKDIVKT